MLWCTLTVTLCFLGRKLLWKIPVPSTTFLILLNNMSYYLNQFLTGVDGNIDNIICSVTEPNPEKFLQTFVQILYSIYSIKFLHNLLPLHCTLCNLYFHQLLRKCFVSRFSQVTWWGWIDLTPVQNVLLISTKGNPWSVTSLIYWYTIRYCHIFWVAYFSFKCYKNSSTK